MTWQVISAIRSAPHRARFGSHGLTDGGFVFNKYVKYGCALANLLGPGRPDPPRPAGAAGYRRGNRGRTRRALRHVVARGVAASQGADRRRPDRASHRGAVAALRVARRGFSRRDGLDRVLSPLLGAAVRQARRLPEADRTESAKSQPTQGKRPWPPPLTISRFA